MSLRIEIIDGEQMGTHINLANGLTIGRQGCDLTLRDSKVSSVHAKVILQNNQWTLIDQGSSNGIKIDFVADEQIAPGSIKGGKRVVKLILVDGATFRLGQTRFRVTSDALPQKGVPEQKSSPPQTAAEPSVKRASWKPILLDLTSRALRLIEAEKTSAGNRTLPQEVMPFRSPINLKFISGPQTGTEWLLGYGPRQIGPDSLDLQLLEAGIPSICFSLISRISKTTIDQSPIETFFETDFSEIVQLNGFKTKVAVLNDGDLIQINNTTIRVEIEPRV
jgi:pSer/pThr/pTyr-binding forkhead associated (FHA) protein